MPFITHRPVDRRAAARLRGALSVCDFLQSGPAQRRRELIQRKKTQLHSPRREPLAKSFHWGGQSRTKGGVGSPGSVCSFHACSVFICRQQTQTCSTSVCLGLSVCHESIFADLSVWVSSYTEVLEARSELRLMARINPESRRD